LNITQEQIYNTNQKLRTLLWKPLGELSKIRNAEKVKEKQIHLGKIKGKRRCIKCGEYFDLNKVVRRGNLRQIYCKACNKTVRNNPKAINWLKT
jgi:formylmethanofuran dehydrogenase subunit E